jgi:[citrate (pro-3S)-lyase] ligase
MMMTERPLSNIRQAENLIKGCGLSVNYHVDYTVGIFDGDDLVATRSLAKDMIQMLAVSPHYQGEDLSAIVITHLIHHSLEKGVSNLHLYTKPDNVDFFLPLGFRVMAKAPPYAALLEWGRPGIDEYRKCLKAKAGDTLGQASAIVMNCNPFTLGHRYLIETAAAQSHKVFVLVVEEDLSAFPFDVRFRLVREGTASFPNVVVIPGGRYVVSSLTFPSYFTRDAELSHAHSSMDVEIFLKHIVPTLNIHRRYIGTEPFSPVTEIYNRTMKERLIPAGVEVMELPRLEKSGVPISASRVRELLAQGDISAVKKLVPKTTFDYLTSGAAVPILRKLQGD